MAPLAVGSISKKTTTESPQPRCNDRFLNSGAFYVDAF
jgi:hypothetical protein